MQQIIVYDSQTGFTARYAALLAEALGCQAVPRRQAPDLAPYDRVIYGGYLIAGRIHGLEKLPRVRSLAVFAVGLLPEGEQSPQRLRGENHLPADVPVWYLRGGMRKAALPVPQRLLLRLLRRAAGDGVMAQCLAADSDHVDPDAIAPLVKALRGV